MKDGTLQGRLGRLEIVVRGLVESMARVEKNMDLLARVLAAEALKKEEESGDRPVGGALSSYEAEGLVQSIE